MPQRDFETRLLDLARSRGILGPQTMDGLEAEALGRSSRWGPRLAVLESRGIIAAQALDALAWELLGLHTGTASDETWNPVNETSPPGVANEFPWEDLPDRYSQVSPLGRGGMGRVVSAYDRLLQRTVALKFLRQGETAREQRVLAEARAQAQVEHPNVCKVFDVAEAGGEPYISMQLIQGQALNQAWKELPRRIRLEVMRDVAEGVHASHRAGLLHLDLKPGNVMVEIREVGRPHPFVIDFGLGRSDDASEGLAPLGTPPFTSPEQARGDARHLDRRTDVYALGVMLYEAVSDKVPFEADNYAEFMQAILEGRAIPIASRRRDVPKDLALIIGKAMALDPSERYATALDFANDLQRFLDGHSVQARPPTLAYRASLWLRRHRLMALGILLGLLVAGGAIVWGARTAMWARQQGEIAQRFEQALDRADASVRQDLMLPPHDVRKARAFFWEQVASIRKEMQQLGGPAQAPGHYALGRAELLFGDRIRALDHLQQAWALGLRTPVLKAALGEAMLSLYFTASEEASRIQNPELRARRLENLVNQMRNPGLAYVQEAGPALSGPIGTSVLARLALFEGRVQDAMAFSGLLQTAFPWLWEGWVLEGRAYSTRAEQEMKAGKYDEALASLDLAERALINTQSRAPSAMGPRRILCEVGNQRAACQLALGQDPTSTVAHSLAWLDSCHAIDPEPPFEVVPRVAALLGQARGLQRAHRDPAEILGRILDLTDRNMDKNPRAAEELGRLRVQALGILVARREASGLPPWDLYEDIQATIERVLRDNPPDQAPQAWFLESLRRRGQAELAAGRDPAHTLETAEKALGVALAQDRHSPGTADMAILLSAIAENAKPREATGMISQARALLTEPPSTDSRMVLAWVRILRVQASLEPDHAQQLLDRARGLLKTARPSTEDSVEFQTEGRKLGLKAPST